MITIKRKTRRELRMRRLKDIKTIVKYQEQVIKGLKETIELHGIIGELILQIRELKHTRGLMLN
jgi:hypothetical protein